MPGPKKYLMKRPQEPAECYSKVNFKEEMSGQRAFIDEYLTSSSQLLSLLEKSEEFKNSIAISAKLMSECIKAGGKIIIAGNGGSAAEANHFSCELVGRLFKERCALPSMTICSDPATLTALANDYSFKDVFSRQLEALASEKDTFIMLTTSGRSENIIHALRSAKQLGMKTIALAGKDTELLDGADGLVSVPSGSTAKIQEVHAVVVHILCGLVEDNFGERK